jgi:hypothetical protein
VCVVCTAACLVELDLISGPRSDHIYHIQISYIDRSHRQIPLVIYHLTLYGSEYNSMARLAGVWMEMVWPLDEGAAVPLCVRTVDQGAPDGGWHGGMWLVMTSCRPAACMRALYGWACDG